MKSLMAGRCRATWLAALLVGVLAACASAPAAPPPGRAGGAVPADGRASRLPPIPAADGPLQLEVGYPPEGATIAARDSNFIFGSTGSGRTQLTINGQQVTVAPNGGFLAFIPVPADGVYRLSATKDGQTAQLERRVTVPAAPQPGTLAARIVSPTPTGPLAVLTGETVEVGLRGPPGARATLVLPDGRRIPLAEQGVPVEGVVGDEFRTDAPAQRAATTVRYAARVPMTLALLSRDTSVARPRVGDLMRRAGPEQAGTEATLELLLENDTARVPLRLNVALLDPDQPRVGVVTAPANPPSDWMIRGRLDTSGPFHFFWPAGTRLTITGERDGFYRVRLAPNRTAWVPAGDVRLLPEGASRVGGAIASARFAPHPDFIDLRIPVPERMPFHVSQDQRTLHVDVFGATARLNFFQYGGLDPLITYAEWTQPTDSTVRISARLSQDIWGYQTFFDPGGALIIRIRRPPAIDAAAPLRGLLIAVDAGHGGEDRATRGPTGLTEADANLYIALQLRDQLQRAGARVLMTRVTDATVPLNDRPRLAADSNAHILISVHNNAFPDGVNPWLNNGTSVYYYHPHSTPLARLMQGELLGELGLRDIGIGRADLALVRATWMPAVLTETMFMMIPEQEAALRDPAVQARVAAAHVRALEAFLRERARN